MGLDARVYLHRNNLPIGLDASQARVDDETGEVYFEQSSGAPQELSLVALDKRLGNASLIHFLAEQVQGVFGTTSKSLLLGRILCSGSHAGDFIAQDDLDVLRDEITSLWELTEADRSSELTKFLEDLRELVTEAEKQGNPIVFV
jgi:hypothetical protein